MLRQLPDFLSISEFTVANDACGPTAEAVALHQAGYPLSPAFITNIRNRDIANGWFNHGEPLASIYTDLTHYYRIPILDYIAYNPTPDDVALLACLQKYAGFQPVIVQFLNAQALAFNESGVFSHFCTIGGYDSNRGFLTANGDDVLALQGHEYYTARWQTWDTLIQAKICGVIVLKAITNMIPTGWRDDGTTLTAPNGNTVVHGFRQYILSSAVGWSPDNMPLGSEVAYNANSAQFFDDTILYWNGTGVVVLSAGSEAWRWYTVSQSSGISPTEKAALLGAMAKVNADLQQAVTDNNAAIAAVK